jgi:hypothetical protein
MHHMSRLVLVMLATVPLMKQIASIRLRTVAPARLLVAWRMSSAVGIPVADARRVAGSQKQNRVTRMNIVPLYRIYQ